MNKGIINKIIDIEWEMFSNVINIGGRASCQQDRETFWIMRASQAKTWSDELLASYLSDLESAREKGRNLMTEKYARMMRYTYQDEYEQLKDILPVIDEPVSIMINEIVKIYLAWDGAVLEKYPYLKAKGRRTRSSEDTSRSTSIETYLRGEIQTYSRKTIEIYYAYCLNRKSQNINLLESNLFNMIKYYGYYSLEQANKKFL